MCTLGRSCYRIHSHHGLKLRCVALQVPLRSTAKGTHQGFQGRVLFDSAAAVEDFRTLQLCESLRVVLLHQDYECDLGPTPSIPALCQWLLDSADWGLGLREFERFGNAGPSSPEFTGVHVRCKTSAGRLPGGASQELRIRLALAVHERFGWAPVIRRGDAALELLVAFHKNGVMLELPLLLQRGVQWEQHAAAESQLTYKQLALAGSLPPLVPQFPKH